MSKAINYDIEKELDSIKCRMHGSHFEQDKVILSDAISLITEAKRCISNMKERYQEGIKAVYKGLDESDDILCPVCGHSLAHNDDFDEMRPKHCEECGTKIIY